MASEFEHELLKLSKFNLWRIHGTLFELLSDNGFECKWPTVLEKQRDVIPLADFERHLTQLQAKPEPPLRFWQKTLAGDRTAVLRRQVTKLQQEMDARRQRMQEKRMPAEIIDSEWNEYQRQMTSLSAALPESKTGTRSAPVAIASNPLTLAAAKDSAPATPLGTGATVATAATDSTSNMDTRPKKVKKVKIVVKKKTKKKVKSLSGKTGKTGQTGKTGKSLGGTKVKKRKEGNSSKATDDDDALHMSEWEMRLVLVAQSRPVAATAAHDASRPGPRRCALFHDDDNDDNDDDDDDDERNDENDLKDDKSHGHSERDGKVSLLTKQNQDGQRQSPTAMDETTDTVETAATQRLLVLFGKERILGKLAVDQLAAFLNKVCVHQLILVTHSGFTPWGQGPLGKLRARYAIRTFRHEDLLTNFMKHQLIKPHIKINEDEKRALMQRHRLSQVEDLPKIRAKDPVCVYKNFKRGDVIRIRNIGAPDNYRLVVD